jgi:hypothetical protein
MVGILVLLAGISFQGVGHAGFECDLDAGVVQCSTSRDCPESSGLSWSCVASKKCPGKKVCTPNVGKKVKGSADKAPKNKSN